jgi:hypothetical protein
MRQMFGIPLTDAPAAPVSAADIAELTALLSPRPSPRPLIRIGGSHDGAYLLPGDLAGIAACISPGVNNRKDFEDDLADRFGIGAHMCDYSSDVSRLATPLKPGLQTFRKLWLDLPGTPDAITLADLVADTCPEPTQDLILQMDIEGAEYRNILAVPDAVLARFRIIVMEVHDMRLLNDPAACQQILLPFFRKIGAGFVPVHLHPNNCCGEVVVGDGPLTLPRVLEVTWLRRDRFDPATGVGKAGPVHLPHPLDVPRNVAAKAPLVMDAALCGGQRSPKARIKMLSDELDYARYQLRQQAGAADRLARVTFATAQGVTKAVLGALAPDLAPDLAPARDLAAGRPFTLSSAWGDRPRTGVVTALTPYFCHTDLGLDPCLTIDLGQVCRLDRLVIHNRTDTAQGRARFLHVTLHDGPEPGCAPAFAVLTDPAFLTADPTPCTTPLGGRAARYVTLSSPAVTAIHLAQVQIWGRPKG